jgi:hypothetical protein
VDQDAGARLERQVAEPQADDLGNSQACGEAEVKHRTVANAIAGGRIGRVEDGLHLLASEIRHERTIGLLGWDGDKAPDLSEGRGDTVLDEPRKRLDRGEPRIAAAGRVAASGLEVLEKGENERRVDLLESEIHRGNAETLAGKLEQQAQGVGVAVAGVLTGSTVDG